jgi:hypothetical protein
MQTKFPVSVQLIGKKKNYLQILYSVILIFSFIRDSGLFVIIQATVIRMSTRIFRILKQNGTLRAVVKRAASLSLTCLEKRSQRNEPSTTMQIKV